MPHSLFRRGNGTFCIGQGQNITTSYILFNDRPSVYLGDGSTRHLPQDLQAWECSSLDTNGTHNGKDREQEVAHGNECILSLVHVQKLGLDYDES